MVLASRVETRSKKDFFGAGGVIDSFPLPISESFAFVKCGEIYMIVSAIKDTAKGRSKNTDPNIIILI
jgi:hypothetical protein